MLDEHAGLERPLRGVPALHMHVPVPGGGLRLSHRALDPSGHIRDQRIAPTSGWAGRAVTGHEDRDSAMYITTPVIHEPSRSPSR